MVELCEEKFGKLTVLFNNAGIMLSEDGGAAEYEESVLTKTLAVNVNGVIWGCKYGIPAMLRTGHGSVINTSSFVALRGAATPQLVRFFIFYFLFLFVLYHFICFLFFNFNF